MRLVLSKYNYLPSYTCTIKYMPFNFCSSFHLSNEEDESQRFPTDCASHIVVPDNMSVISILPLKTGVVPRHCLCFCVQFDGPFFPKIPKESTKVI